jgi:zinc transport system ATP-binding protein
MLSFEKQQFSELSGGEQQRVLIARAISSNPKILFFDEPTNSIDSLSEQNLQTILKDLKGKMTIVMVSHNIRFVSELVEKVICVGKGNISIHKAEIISNQVESELGIEHYKLIKHLHCKHSGSNNE